MILQKSDFTEFLFFRPKARHVYLAGDFNGWRLVSMIRQDDGYWLARLALPQGVYKFRYNADGQWFADYAAFGIEYGPFGIDSIVRVDQVPQRLRIPMARQDASQEPPKTHRGSSAKPRVRAARAPTTVPA
jgi:1,4-alpha-glucan branching enzyme